MKNRYKKFVYEDERGITFEANAKKGMTFELSEGTSGELCIKARKIDTNLDFPTISAGEYAEQLSIYTDYDGNKAVVPAGWTVSGMNGESTIWGRDVALVIYRIPKEQVKTICWGDPDEVDVLKGLYSQLVWCPVKLLEANGTLDGVHFSKKFGRRNYLNDEFSTDEFHETLKEDFLEQIENVERYGGFYFSRYNISENLQGELQSVKGVWPLVYMHSDIAIKTAGFFEENENLKSHLTYGAEYDSILAWIIQSGGKTPSEIFEDSTNWGNFRFSGFHRRLNIGNNEKWCVNQIYDLAGNFSEWTQEEYGSSRHVIRGGCAFTNPTTVAYRGKACTRGSSLRASFYIKI